MLCCTTVLYNSYVLRSAITQEKIEELHQSNIKWIMSLFNLTSKHVNALWHAFSHLCHYPTLWPVPFKSKDFRCNVLFPMWCFLDLQFLRASKSTVVPNSRTWNISSQNILSDCNSEILNKECCQTLNTRYIEHQKVR